MYNYTRRLTPPPHFTLSFRTYFLKVSILLYCIFSGLLSTQTQAQDPYFSQYYSSSAFLNPALAGAEKDIYFGINYRSQWSSLGSPLTTGQFSIIAPLDNKNPRKLHGNGIGLSIYNDVAGQNSNFKTTGINLSFAHNIVLDENINNVFSLGGQVGLAQKRIDFNDLQWGSQYDPFVGFNANIPSSAGQFAQRVTLPLLSFGAMWYNNPRKNYASDNFSSFAGFAVANLNHPNESMLSDQVSRLPLLYKLHGGAEWKISPYFNVSPNFLAMQQNGVRQFNMGTYLTYKAYNQQLAKTSPTYFTLGSWYRVGDAFIFSTGVSTKNYTIGFSYDMNVSSLRYHTRGRGAYEISISYKIVKESPIKKFSTPLM